MLKERSHQKKAVSEQSHYVSEGFAVPWKERNGLFLGKPRRLFISAGLTRNPSFICMFSEFFPLFDHYNVPGVLSVFIIERETQTKVQISRVAR